MSDEKVHTLEQEKYATGIQQRDKILELEKRVKELEAKKPMEMWLCESQSLILRANQPYYFKVNPTCARCWELYNQSAVDSSETLMRNHPNYGKGGTEP